MEVKVKLRTRIECNKLANDSMNDPSDRPRRGGLLAKGTRLLTCRSRDRIPPAMAAFSVEAKML